MLAMSMQGRDSDLQSLSIQPDRLQALRNRRYIDDIKSEGLFCIFEPGELRRLECVIILDFCCKS